MTSLGALPTATQPVYATPVPVHCWIYPAVTLHGAVCLYELPDTVTIHSGQQVHPRLIRIVAAIKGSNCTDPNARPIGSRFTVTLTVITSSNHPATQSVLILSYMDHSGDKRLSGAFWIAAHISGVTRSQTHSPQSQNLNYAYVH